MNEQPSAEKDVAQPPSPDCIAVTRCIRYGECRALTPCKTTRDTSPEGTTS